MARKPQLPIVEAVRQDAHDDGVLDQRYKDAAEGHVAQVKRNIAKSQKTLRSGK